MKIFCKYILKAWTKNREWLQLNLVLFHEYLKVSCVTSGQVLFKSVPEISAITTPWKQRLQILGNKAVSLLNIEGSDVGPKHVEV